MKSLLFLLVTIFIICGCEKQKSPQEQAEFNRQVNSTLKSLVKEVYLDTTGIANAPVKLLSAKFIKADYSDYRDISLKYKNVSKKTIEAIRFEWYGENVFGEIADNGHGYGISESKLKPNATSSGVWKALSRDGRNVLIAKPIEVVFSDGTKWKLKND